MSSLTRPAAMNPCPRYAILCLAALLALAAPAGLLRCAGAGEGKLELAIFDKDSSQPIACRMHLKNAAGRPRLPSRPTAGEDYFIIPGKINLKLPTGNYTFEIERGPEYAVTSGHFTINRFADDTKRIELKRHADMAGEGWWSGDLDLRRSWRDVQLVMDAEDLHVVPLVSWTNAASQWTTQTPPKELLLQFPSTRMCQLMGGEDARPGGALHYFNLPAPLPLARKPGEYPPVFALVERLREQPGAWVDAARPTAWDLPTLVALGQVDSIQVAHGALRRGGGKGEEPGGKPRDKEKYPGPGGVARWSQDIYFHLLNCGLRVPPSAGSGAGAVPNPAGYNRLYVQVDGPLAYEKWWDGLRAGRVTVTNGPLLRPAVDGHPPGHVFTAEPGESLELEIALTLSARDPISYLEIIKNGEVAQMIRFADYQKSGRLPKVHFDGPGWFALRVVSDIGSTYRFALTGPYYVEFGGQRRISRASVRFFLDWLTERAAQLQLEDADQRAEVLAYHRKARDFWKGLVEKANAE